MRVLVIGNGGREHVLVWKIKQSPLVSKIYCAPGNGGTCEEAINVDIKVDDLKGLLEFAQKEKVDLTVVGPELPLVLGIVDEFQKSGLRVFGPQKSAAELEGSKVFTKEFLERYHIPTAKFGSFTDPDLAKDYIKTFTDGVVVKADGLAAGKGVSVCASSDEAILAVDQIMVDQKFGDAGRRIVVEEFLTGEEASFLVISDGDHFLPLVTAQDHKAIFDGDTGPNTGGMGAYSPAPLITEKLQNEIMEGVIAPVLKGMKEEGREFKGILYAGLMIDNDRSKVLEFNVRFGDPEVQPILMRMKSDIVPILNASIDSTLNQTSIEWHDMASTCVVMASEGYPGNYPKGKVISGLSSASQDSFTMKTWNSRKPLYPERKFGFQHTGGENRFSWRSTKVFHAGTKRVEEKILTDGGRVLGVTALGKDIKESIENAYQAVSKISFDGAYFRKDIGQKALD